MTKSELRAKLHGYIDVADDRHLEAIYVLVEKEMSSGYVYDEETLKELDHRRENHYNGTSQSYTAEESIEMIRRLKK